MRRAVGGAVVVALALSGSAFAETKSASKKKSGTPVAAVSSSGQAKAKESFDAFSREWMVKMESAARETAKKSGGGGSTLRGYQKDFTTEVKETGSSSAPYVGLLRYVEEELQCKDAALKDCKVVNTTGVTEIFRFQGGKWIY